MNREIQGILHTYRLIYENKSTLNKVLSEGSLEVNTFLKASGIKELTLSLLKEVFESTGCDWKYKKREGIYFVFTTSSGSNCYEEIIKKIQNDNELKKYFRMSVDQGSSDLKVQIFKDVTSQGPGNLLKGKMTVDNSETSTSNTNRNEYSSVDQRTLEVGKVVGQPFAKEQITNHNSKIIQESASFGRGQRKQGKSLILPKDKNKDIYSLVIGTVRPPTPDGSCPNQLRIKTIDKQTLKYCNVQNRYSTSDQISIGDHLGKPSENVTVYLYDKDDNQIDIDKLIISKPKENQGNNKGNTPIQGKYFSDKTYSDPLLGAAIEAPRALFRYLKDLKSKKSKESDVTEEIDRIKKLI